MTGVLTRAMGGLWWRLAAAVVLAVAAIGASIGLLATSGYLISQAALAPPILDLSVAIVAVRFFALARAGARYAERLAAHDVALRVMVDLRAWLFARLEPLLPGVLPGSGDLLQRLAADVDAMQEVVLRVVSPPLVALAALPLALVVVAPLGGGTARALAGVFLVACLLTPAAGYLLSARFAASQARAQARLAERLLECVDAAPELDVLGAAGFARERVAEAERAVETAGRRLAATGATLDAAVTALTGVAVGAVLVGGAAAVVGGRAAGPLLAAGVLAALAVFEAAQAMPAAAQRLAAVRASSERLAALPAAAGAGGGHLPARPGALRLDGVWFRYRDDLPWVLRGATLELRPGERVALLGPSGGGKTTAALLMSGFLAPTSGHVRLAGDDLREIDPATLRPLVCLCAQDAHVFNTTLLDNVRVGRPSATEQEVEAALARVQLLDWARALPEALLTPCGEDGGRLSAGQRQRLAVARALVAEASIVLLDEPTANLDDRTATALVRDLLTALEGRSVLLITHRADGLERMDRVLELRHAHIEAAAVA